MPHHDPVIRLDNISLIREGRRLLDDVSLTVSKGEHWAVLGPNGCGKTTLLNIVTGYLWPSTGTVTVLGDRYGEVDLRRKRRQIGLVSSALFERVPGGDTFTDIVLSGRFANLGMYDEPETGDEIRAREIVSFLGREYAADRPYRILSFGERQSAHVGRALMADPSLLILDEPCEGLDLPTREHLLERIDSIAADPDGPTVIFVTHRVEEISPGITHAALMREGRIIHSGPKDAVLSGETFREAFGTAVELVRKNGRMYAQVE